MIYVYNPTDKDQSVGRWTVPALSYMLVSESDAAIISATLSPLKVEGEEGYKPLFLQYGGQPQRH